MTTNTYIQEEIAAAQHRDLLEAAEHGRLIAQARQHHRPRRRALSLLRRRALRHRMTVEPRHRVGPDLHTHT
jgi:hypothetical protein